MHKRSLMDSINKSLAEEVTHLHSEKKPVFGEGNLDSRLVLVGEAPGEQEEKQERPFVGQAGKNLQEFLDILGLKREDIYITNVVKFRPVKINEKTGRKSNRAPNRNEIELCGKYLIDELKVISPTVVVTLGNVPLKFILGDDKTVGECHGKSYIYNINKDGPESHVFCLYHPASIIYRRELAEIYKMDLAKLRGFLTNNEVI